MINREGRDYPDDSGHVRGLEAAGARVYRDEGRLAGPGRVAVGSGATYHELAAQTVILAVGSATKVPPVDGIGTVRAWTNKDAMGARVLPRRLLVLGGGPTGVEISQLYARFGVPTMVVQSGPRLLPNDHPRNGEAARQALQRDGVTVRLGVAHARQGHRRSGRRGRRRGLTKARRPTATPSSWPSAGLPVRAAGAGDDRDRPVGPDGARRDGRLRIADGVYLAGDSAGPSCTPTRPTTRAYGRPDGARRRGDAGLPGPAPGDLHGSGARVRRRLAGAGPVSGTRRFQLVADFATTSKGYSVEATFGHVTTVVDRVTRQLLGAAMATPDASAAIHECVLAIKARVPMEVLADTIHAFPSTSRILNGLFNDAAKELATPTTTLAASGDRPGPPTPPAGSAPAE